jgi:hypothetical protein
MAYRICTFDATGKITSVSSISYEDEKEVIAEFTAFNTSAFGFINESLIPAGLIDSTDTESISRGSVYGLAADYSESARRSTAYDPRTEVVLVMENPYPYISHGNVIVQDVTRAIAVYNSAIGTLNRPLHSTTIKKFGPTSAKFTAPGGGYTGGYIYVTNLSKRTQGGFTAPHNNIAGGQTHCYAFELFFYPTSMSSNFTLLQKGPTGASANWKIGYDSSAGFLQFAWQSYGYTLGYNYSQNIVNSAGFTTNAWHHVAVAAVKNTGGTGYLLSGYFNGANVFSQSVTFGTMPEVRYNNGIYIGNNSIGSEPFSGYIDSLRVLEQPGTAGIFGPTGYGFLPFGGGTLGVPTLAGFTRGSSTALVMNFNGQSGSYQFHCESPDYVTASVTRTTNLILGGASGASLADQGEVGTRNVLRYTIDTTGFTTSDPTGFSTNFGAIVNPYINFAPAGSTAFYVHGTDYIFNLYSVVDTNPDIDVIRTNYINDLLYDRSLELMGFIEGISGNKGSSGNVFNSTLGKNPFRRLFGASGNSYGSCGNHNSLYLNPLDMDTMQYIMDNGYLATQGICASSYSFVDGKGFTRTVSATDISNLRLDILEHQNNLRTASNTAITNVKSSSTRASVVSIVNNKTPWNAGEAPNVEA